MSGRKTVYVIKDRGCDGGQSPNAYVPRITVEIRVHFPPDTVSHTEVEDTLLSAVDSVDVDLDRYFKERDSA